MDVLVEDQMQIRDGSMQGVLPHIAEQAEAAGVFASVEVSDTQIQCAALDAAADAQYCLMPRDAGWVVCLATPDRWLSESIEADLMHLGDKIEELIEEELVELGHPAGLPRVDHFRDDAMMYVFQTPLPIEPDLREDTFTELALRHLLAYEAAFRQLGDMRVTDET
jgi:hypothetical protein